MAELSLWKSILVRSWERRLLSDKFLVKSNCCLELFDVLRVPRATMHSHLLLNCAGIVRNSGSWKWILSAPSGVSERPGVTNGAFPCPTHNSSPMSKSATTHNPQQSGRPFSDSSGTLRVSRSLQMHVQSSDQTVPRSERALRVHCE